MILEQSHTFRMAAIFKTTVNIISSRGIHPAGPLSSVRALLPLPILIKDVPLFIAENSKIFSSQSNKTVSFTNSL